MNAKVPYLPVTEFCFVYKTINEIKIPPFPGALLHGAFGNALFKTTCRVPGTDCKECMFKNSCAYTKLFKSQHIIKTGDIKNLHEVPSPHVFRFDNQSFIHIPEKHNFEIKMVVVGNAVQQAADLFSAMELLGENGIKNKKVKLEGIKQLSHTAMPQYVSSAEHVVEAEQIEIPAMPNKIRIELLTPYIQGADHLQEFGLRYWLMRVIRRVSILQRVYTEKTSLFDKDDFKALKTLTEKLTSSHKNIILYRTVETDKSFTSGYLGSIEISLDGMEALWPWLYLGQWINAGKKTSYGYGRYQLLLVN